MSELNTATEALYDLTPAQPSCLFTVTSSCPEAWFQSFLCLPWNIYSRPFGPATYSEGLSGDVTSSKEPYVTPTRECECGWSQSSLVCLPMVPAGMSILWGRCRVVHMAVLGPSGHIPIATYKLLGNPRAEVGCDVNLSLHWKLAVALRNLPWTPH